MRNNSTLAEVLQWNELKRKQAKGHDFYRQKPIDNYIVDFYCPTLKLAIEIDGESHFGLLEEDKIRQKALETLGVRFLRFHDSSVKRDMRGVLKAIEKRIDDHEST